MEPEPRRIWVAKIYEMNAARALLDHADNTLAGSRFAEESVEPLLTVASIGCEKVLKMTLGVINTEVHGAWPSKQVMKTFGHDVVTLDSQCRRLFRERSELALAKGYFKALQDEADADGLIGTFLTVLARYASNGRFYYLDDLADNPQDLPAPSEFWSDVESQTLQTDPEILQLLNGTNQDVDAAVARSIGHVRTSLARWRNLYYRAWIQGVCGEQAKAYGWQLQLPKRNDW
jgi:hypothetical protein